MNYVMNSIAFKNVDAKSYPKPTVLLVDFGASTGEKYCLVGCDYGYLHTTSGDVRTWNSYSGAAKVKRLYVGMKAGE